MIRANGGFGIFIRDNRASIDHAEFDSNLDAIRAGKSSNVVVTNSLSHGIRT